MSTSRLQRTYLLRGLDRMLYSTPPQWQEGTFLQAQVDVGRLVLHIDDIYSVAALDEAIQITDRIAERFRLAISMRVGCPLTLALEKSEEPEFNPWTGQSSVDTQSPLCA